MTETKDFLDLLQAYKSPGQLKNFGLPESEVSSKSEGLKALEKVEGIEKAVSDLALLASYIEQAKMASVSDDPWVSEAEGVMGECTERIAAAGGEIDASTRQDLLRKLGECKDRYAARYADMHARARLGPSTRQAQGEATFGCALQDVGLVGDHRLVARCSAAGPQGSHG
jgi:hypothetical protein